MLIGIIAVVAADFFFFSLIRAGAKKQLQVGQ
jgi:hypothetical protein